MLLGFLRGTKIIAILKRYASMKKIVYDFMVPFLYPILGAIIGGATMGILNVLVVTARKSPLFGFRDVFIITSWHMVIWVLFGAIFGIIYALVSALTKRKRAIYLHPFILISTFMACWLFSYGYLNILFSSGFVNFVSIILSLIIMIIGLIVFIILLIKLRTAKGKIFQKILKFQIIFLIAIVLISIISNKAVPLRDRMDAILAKKNENYKYNVILIVLDAVRHDHLSCYGYKNKTTPNIDLLAHEGVLFENAYASSSHTMESIPSLLTSCYASTHNVKNVTSIIPKNLIILPEIFKNHGYKTSIFSVNPFVSPAYGYGRGVDDFYSLEENVIKIDKTVLGYQLNYFPAIPVLQKIFKSVLKFSYSFFPSEAAFNDVAPNLITQRVMRWISDTKEEPFFIYIHYDGGHAPYNPPETYWRLFNPDHQGKPVQEFPMGWGIFLPFIKGKQLPQQDIDSIIACYDGEIFYHDKCLGQLFKHLEELDLSEKTIISIISDHGEEIYEHQGWGHGHSLFE